MTGHEVGVPEASEAADAHLLGDSHAMEERLVFSNIVGAGLEGNLHGVLELVPLGGCEDDAGPGAVVRLGAVEVERPQLLVLGWFIQLGFFPVDEEVCQRLRDGSSWDPR